MHCVKSHPAAKRAERNPHLRLAGSRGPRGNFDLSVQKSTRRAGIDSRSGVDLIWFWSKIHIRFLQRACMKNWIKFYWLTSHYFNSCMKNWIKFYWLTSHAWIKERKHERPRPFWHCLLSAKVQYSKLPVVLPDKKFMHDARIFYAWILERKNFISILAHFPKKTETVIIWRPLRCPKRHF